MEEDNKIIDKRPKIIDDIGLFSEDKETANAPITSPQEELQRDFSQQTTLKTPSNYNPTYITTGDLSLVKPEVQIPRPKIIDDIGLLDEEGKDTQGSAGSGVVGAIKNIANEAYDVVRNANWASLLPSAETPPDIKDENNAINPYLKKHPYLYGVLSNSYEYSKLPAELTATILGATAGMGWASVLTGAGAYAGVKSLERVANNWMYGDKLPETLPEAAAETALNFALGTLGVSPNKPKHLIEGMFSPEELKAKGFEMPFKGALGHVENFVRSMFGASKRFEERDKRNIEALQNSINEYIKNPSQDSVGTKIKNSIENIFKSKDIEDKKLIEKEYRDIMTELKMGGESSTTNYLRDLKKAKESLVKNKDKSWKEVTEAYNRSKALIPDSLRSEAEAFKGEAENVLRELGGRENVPGELVSFLEKYAKAPETIKTYTFQALDDIRKEMHGMLNPASLVKPFGVGKAGLSKPGNSSFISQYTPGLIKAIESDMKSLAKQADSLPVRNPKKRGAAKSPKRESYKVFLDAQKTAAEAKATFTEKTALRIMEDYSSHLVDIAFRPNTPEAVLAARKAIGKEEFDELVKPAIVKKLVGNLAEYAPETLAKNLNRYGEDTIDAALGKGTYNYLRKIANEKRGATDTVSRSEVSVKFLKSLIGTYNESEIAGELARKGSIDDFVYIHNLQKNEGVRSSLRASYLENMFYKGQKRNPDGSLADFDADVFTRNINGAIPALRKFMDEDSIKTIQKLAVVSKEMNTVRKGLFSGGIGKLQAGQLGLAGTALYAGHIPSAAIIMLSPVALSYLMATKQGRNMIDMAIKINSKTVVGRKLLTAVMLYTTKLKSEEENREIEKRNRLYRKYISNKN